MRDPINADIDTDWVDITIFLEEALLRSGEAGIKFSSSDLFILTAGWTHYNIDGKGSTFYVIGNLSKTDKKLTINHNYYEIFVKSTFIFEIICIKRKH